jgi:hypothetical protein
MYRARYVSRAPRLLYSARQQQSYALPPDPESAFRVNLYQIMYNTNTTYKKENKMLGLIGTVLSIGVKLMFILIALAGFGILDITDAID